VFTGTKPTLKEWKLVSRGLAISSSTYEAYLEGMETVASLKRSTANAKYEAYLEGMETRSA